MEFGSDSNRSFFFARLLSALAIGAGLSSTALSGVTPISQTLRLGPLSRLTSIATPDSKKDKSVEPQYELDVESLWPRDKDTVLLAPGLASGGTAPAWTAVPLSDPFSDLTWLVVYVDLDRFASAEVKVEADGAYELFVDGAKAKGRANWRRGRHRLAIRTEGTVKSIAIDVTGEARVDPTLDPKHGLSDYAETKQFGSVSSPVISDDGRYLAYVVKEPSANGTGARRLEIVDTNGGSKVACGVFGAATPIEWTKDGSQLLLKSGDDIVLWSRDGSGSRTVLAGEKTISKFDLASNAQFIVYAATDGVKDKPESGPKRRVELREKLSDWPTSPHLFLASVGGATRRRLTLPGDCVYDAFSIFPNDRELLWLRSVPVAERPWFETEFHRLDLYNGKDKVVATLRMGFENRPGLTDIAISPDGKRVAFLAPRSELGAKADVEPNVFDPDLFVLDLESGVAKNMTEASDVSPEARLRWSADGNTLYFEGTQRAAQRVYAMKFAADGAKIEPLGFAPFEGAISAISIAPNGAFGGVFSAPDRLPELHCSRPEFGKGTLLVAAPNKALESRFAFSKPQAWDTLPVAGGSDSPTPIQAWLYRPDGRFVVDGKVPLVVYYYGGATPTLFGFNDLHQYLVANGFGVLVVNPRGCGGYGDAFSLSHVADWGDRAGADILAALASALEKEPHLDTTKVGCYGGSYGGFMTMWLVSHSDRFAAAVSMYGIANLASYFGDGQWGYTYGDQATAKLYPWSDSDFYVKHSPLFSAQNIHTPLLLLHGDVDTNVPPNESEQMFTALKLLGRDVELVRFPGEDHGLRGKDEDRIAHREMLLDWFDAKLRGQPAAWKARW